MTQEANIPCGPIFTASDINMPGLERPDTTISAPEHWRHTVLVLVSFSWATSEARASVLSLQTCPSLASTPVTMTSSWWCAAIAVKSWSRRRLKSTVSAGTAPSPSCTAACAPPLRLPRPRGPYKATLHLRGPMLLLLLLLHGVRGEVRYEWPLPHPPPRPSLNTPRPPRMDYGKNRETNVCLDAFILKGISLQAEFWMLQHRSQPLLLRCAALNCHPRYHLRELWCYRC